VLDALTKDGANYLRLAKRWHFDLPDANSKPKRVKGFTDLKATEQLASEMDRRASRIPGGYTDQAEELAAARSPISYRTAPPTRSERGHREAPPRYRGPLFGVVRRMRVRVPWESRRSEGGRMARATPPG
jgi:hypothetical protein